MKVDKKGTLFKYIKIATLAMLGLAVVNYFSKYREKEKTPHTIIIEHNYEAPVKSNFSYERELNPQVNIIDNTLMDKFIRENINNKENINKSEWNISSELKDDNLDDDLISNKKWVEAGEPYLVPQLDETNKKLKVKHFLVPSN